MQMVFRPALLIAVLLFLLAVPAAEAAPRKVPFAFYGVQWDGAATHASEAAQEEQFALMARSGVETVRAVFSWEKAQPRLSDAFDLDITDRLVARAVRHGMRVLPVVLDAPAWARRFDHPVSPPERTSDYAKYVEALVRRYGSNGTFWTERPDLPKRPIRAWQIWNEPHLRYRWYTSKSSPARWPGGYIKLLRDARNAIKQNDRRGKVVLAGLTNDSWNHLAALYRAGGRRLFDIAAIQTYTASPRKAVKAIRLFRKRMRARGDSRKPIWATETGWPAAKGRMDVPEGVKTLVTTDEGMASRLRRVYAGIIKRRRHPRYRVQRVYWYTWASPYRGDSDIFDYAGLLSYSNGVFKFRPALQAYQESARRFQGCAKTATGSCR